MLVWWPAAEYGNCGYNCCYLYWLGRGAFSRIRNVWGVGWVWTVLVFVFIELGKGGELGWTGIRRREVWNGVGGVLVW